MKVIWKFTMTTKDASIEMPQGAKIMSCQTQVVGDKVLPIIWALVDNQASKETRRFIGIGTGEEIGPGGDIPIPIEELEFVATAQMKASMVFHIFEVK